MKKAVIFGVMVLLSSVSSTFADSAKLGEKQIAANHAQAEKNKELVLKAYQELLGDHDITALDRYWSEDYIQHNPHQADGRKDLKEALTRIGIFSTPKNKIEVVRAIAEGDLVFMETHQKPPGSPDLVLADIFRVKDNMIVEHWDVIQSVPADATNPRPMY
jgi:predicted SnoaL-like aldol condensation-catalyzing enzyme